MNNSLLSKFYSCIKKSSFHEALMDAEDRQKKILLSCSQSSFALHHSSSGIFVDKLVSLHPGCIFQQDQFVVRIHLHLKLPAKNSSSSIAGSVGFYFQ